MMRKLLIVVLCGFVQQSAGSRMRFEQAFHDPVYRHDPHIPIEGVYKREHFFPRDSIAPPQQILPQHHVGSHASGIMRNEPIYGNEAIMAHPPPQQTVIPNEDFLSNEQIMQNEPIMRNEAFIRGEPILRREPFIRREPMLRREPFLRPEPMIRGGRIYPNHPAFRDGGLFRNEPNGFTVMVTPCGCQDHQNMGPNGPQEAFFQIPQPIQPMQQQPMVAHRIIFPKPMMKPQPYPSFVTFPRIQRFVSKNFKPMTENIQFSQPQVQNTPVQEFNSYNNEPYSVNCQSQGQQPENTSEPSQTTVRNMPQMPNPLALAQMSSIC